MRKNLILAALAVLFTLSLSACQSPSLPAFETFTNNDLTSAKALADANGDTVASTCYAQLQDVAKAAESAVPVDANGNPVSPPGAFTAFQVGRDVANATSGTGKTGVACAPLVNQTKSFFSKFLNLFGLAL